MIQRAKASGDFVAAAMIAVMVAGFIYVGVLFLNNTQHAGDFPEVEGAIRLAQPQKNKNEDQQKRKRLKDREPPKALPKTFSSKIDPNDVKPLINLGTPGFSADMHPGLMGGIAMPTGDLGGIGFNMDEVDEIPQVLRSIPPEYPYGAKRNRVEGQVVVRMLVTSKGVPSNLSIESANPPNVFEKAALGAAKRWKFRPGRYKGQAVDTWVLLPFNFELRQ